MKSLFTSSLLMLVVFLSGCASILNEKTQPINVASSTGADISGTVNGVPFKAPGIITIIRDKKDLLFVTETEGCAKETIVPKEISGMFWLNILSGGTLGSSTDYSTDKMWKYNDNVIISCKK
jgi:hypothetical protein